MPTREDRRNFAGAWRSLGEDTYEGPAYAGAAYTQLFKGERLGRGDGDGREGMKI